MSLELDARGSIAHLNARKEGPDDAKVLACDVKLEACMPNADVLAHFSPTLRAMLFAAGEILETDNGPLPTFALAYPMMAPISWGGELLHMEVEVGGIELRNSTVRKFLIAPRIEKGLPAVTLTFSATFKPDSDEVAQLAELLQEDVNISVRPRPQLDLRPGIESVSVEIVAP